ncbi:HAE1 family hydrophobic/amphiphilic exporter-1 [Sinobaca qinghaiensis]|uniref:HAE1 family hydrophobic/amphiphilic exporter-1 n=1 Tax=Sinobaca qinghaiensis TaxID=342944 RepID=A0A419UX05_9BACL|nr:efflux RND transporter permease subunit [Sinobaca qinghaiensis]RKD69678.1 HAE1 family hydrophobic/amphiphilic exporter-1 [Sinobaca qinghaiensis]
MKMWDLSIKRPKFTIVIMLVLLILGAVSLTRLPIQLFPDVEAPVAAVSTSYPGAGPEEVLNDVTENLEEELSTVSGLDQLTSQSLEGSSIVIMEFTADTDIEDVETEVVSTITQADLPDDAGTPAFLQFDPSMFPSIQLAVSGGGDEVPAFQEETASLERELSRVDGVASISESGSLTEQYEVVLDQAELENAGISQSDVVQVIRGQEAAVPGGVIVDEEQGETISTRILSELTSPEEIEELTVSQDPESGDAVPLSDVAEISLQTEEEDVITRVNQESSIQLDVMQESDADTTQVSSDFNEELDSLLDESEYSGLEAISLYDEGEYVQDSINSVITALVSGGILAMVVLFAFLRNLKTPLIIGIAIPFSIITTFALFFFTNISLNMMTLGGLALGIGMLVDNSIVVVENIYRHLSMKKTPKQAAADGTREVAGAITASTLTTVSIFLPVVFITGLVGDLFAPLSIAVAFSLIASLFVAVTIVPMIASRILTAPKEEVEKKRKNSSMMKRVERVSRWTLRRRAVVIAITFATLIIGALGLTTTGVEFLPDSDEGIALVEVEHEEGTTLGRTEETIAQIEEELDDDSDIESYLSTIGSTSQQGGLSSESHTAEIIVNLVDAGERDTTTAEFTESLADEIEDIDDAADIEVQDFAQAGLGGEPNTYSFTIEDPDSERLATKSGEIVEALEDESIIRSATSTEEETAPELQVSIDREAAEDEGLAPAQIAEAVNTATGGEVAGSITTDSNDTYNVNVRYADSVLESAENFEDISIPNQEGDYITLSDVAEIEEGQSPAVINRADMITSADFDVLYQASSDLSDASEVVDDVIDDVGLAGDAEFVVGGDQAMIDDLIGDVSLAFVLGLIFIYLVMAAQFESFKYPFIIMFTVPLFVIGVMLALTITQNPISAMALIGVIVLAGIVVNNAIVLVDYINQQKQKGLPTVEAIVSGVQDRTRPILITAITTILGIIPLALGIGEGAEIIQPMGIVIIGGLISSTFLTLFVIPVIYSLFDKSTRNMNKKFMTPDGQVVYKRDLDTDTTSVQPVDKREKYLASEHAATQETIETKDTKTNNEITTETKDQETKDQYSKDEIVGILEELVKKTKSSSDDNKNNNNNRE